MTYTPTHLSLQSLVVWLLLSKKNKLYYQEHRWEYIIISLFAMFPDIDLLFGMHRSYTHSLIIPTFIILSMLIIEKVYKDVSTIETPTRKVVRFVKLASLMWIIHIFLDLSWGPLLLFWPVDPNLYDLSIYLRFENTSWLFFPLTLVGIIPDWTIYSPAEGQKIYFINLSQEERQAIYGNYIDLYIAQFTLHLLLFIVWFVVIVIPAFRRKKKREAKEQKRFILFSKAFWTRLKRHLTLLGIFVIFLGLLLGPIIGNNKEMNYNISSQYKNTNALFDPTLGITIEGKSFANTTVEFSSDISLVKYNVSMVLTDNNTFTNFFNDFDNLTQIYYDGNITYNQLLGSYFSLTNQLISNSYFHLRLIQDQVLNGTLFQLNTTDEITTIYLVTFVDEWNLNESYIYNAKITVSYIINRDLAQIEGGVLDCMGLVLIISDQLLIYFQNRKKITQQV